MKLMIDPAMPNHPKVSRLAAALKVNAREARGIVLSLWAWTMTYHESGSLAGVSAPEIATAADWPLDRAQDLLEALIETQLLDHAPDLSVHDWHEEQGKLLVRRERERRKKQRQRANQKARSVRRTVPSKGDSVSPPPSDSSPMKMYPGDTGGTSPPTMRGTSPSFEGQGREGKGKEGKGEGEETETPAHQAPEQVLETASEQRPPAPAPKEPSEEQGTGKAREVTERIVELWNVGRSKAEWIRVTPKRIAKVKARLKDFTEEQLRLVVARIKDSAWHQGDNDRGWRAGGPEWVLESVERVEEWLAKGGSNGSGNSTSAGGNGSRPAAHRPRLATDPGALSVGAGIGRFFTESKGDNGHAS